MFSIVKIIDVLMAITLREVWCTIQENHNNNNKNNKLYCFLTNLMMSSPLVVKSGIS